MDKKTKAQQLREKMERERVGRAAFEAGKRPINKEETPVIEPQEAAEQAKEEQAVTVPSEVEKPQEAQETPVSDDAEQEPVASSILTDLIPKQKKPKRNTYGFYLDDDVIAELIRLTKQTKAKNKSVFLNALLRRVFFGE